MSQEGGGKGDSDQRGSVRTQSIRPHDWEVRVSGPRGPVWGAERVEARAKQVGNGRVVNKQSREWRWSLQ